jgi:hypothetical protein
MPHENALQAPPDAAADAEAVELARVWISQGGLEVSLRVGVFEDPTAWGILLADLARHVARAHEQLDGSDPQQTMDLIREALDAEWAAESDEAAGSLLEDEEDETADEESPDGEADDEEDGATNGGRGRR